MSGLYTVSGMELSEMGCIQSGQLSRESIFNIQYLMPKLMLTRNSSTLTCVGSVRMARRCLGGNMRTARGYPDARTVIHSNPQNILLLYVQNLLA